MTAKPSLSLLADALNYFFYMSGLKKKLFIDFVKIISSTWLTLYCILKRLHSLKLKVKVPLLCISSISVNDIWHI